MGNVKDSTASGVKWSAIDRFSGQGTQFVISIILARMLSPSDFGVIAMLSIFIAVSQTFVDSGFSSALVRKLDRSNIDFSTTYIFNIAIGLFCFCIFWLISPYIAVFYSMPILEEITPAFGFSIFLNSLTVVHVALFTIKIDFKTLAFVNISSALVSGVIGILCAYHGGGAWALVWMAISKSAINVVLLHVFSYWKPSLNFSWKSFKELFSYGSKLLLSSLINTVYANSAPLLIGKFYTPYDLGYYDRGRQFGLLPIDNLVAIFQRVAFPVLSNSQKDEREMIKIYRKFLKASSIVLFFIAISMVFYAKPIVLFFLTSKWEESIIFLQLFCLSEMFNHITKLNLTLLQVVGRTDLFLRLEIIKKIISFVLLLSAVPFGIIAICISQIIYAQIALFINTYYTRKIFNLGYLSQVRDFLPYIIKAVFACCPAVVLLYLDLSPIMCLLIGYPLSAFLFFYFFIGNDVLYKEMKKSLISVMHIHF